MRNRTLLGALLSLSLLIALTPVKAKETTAESAKLRQLTAQLMGRFREQPDAIQQTAIPNIYQATFGTDVIYVSDDGKYMLQGDLINMDTGENFSEKAKRSVRLKMLREKDNKPVIFKAKNEKQVLTVFTDIDCPYCAKLHREVPTLNEKGITIKYLMFPRAGLQSQSYAKAVSMWCADDQQQALTDAKARKPIPSKTCDNPVADQYRLGQSMGVTGTPALVTSTGRLIPGYMPADRLIAALNRDKAVSK